MKEAIYFISDAHLGAEEEEKEKIKEEKLVSFLDRIKADVESLYILGICLNSGLNIGMLSPKLILKS